MKRYLLPWAWALLAALLLSGCWQEELPEDTGFLIPDEEEPGEENDGLPEVLALPYVPDQTLDPITCPDGMQQVVASLVCEGLFRINGRWEAENALCTGYTYDPDAYVYVFTLREGVSFSDGSPLTASDVKAALDRARGSERYQARLAQISAISVRDGAVTVRLSEPNSGFPALLDVPVTKDQSDLPVGTGPYALVHEDGGMALIANDLWWRGAGQPVERIALVEAADQETMMYRFTSQEVQLVTADLTGASSIAAVGSISYQDAATTVMQYIGCNTTQAPLDRGELRRALGEGINRSQIVSGFLSGHGAAAQFPISPLSDLYPAGLEQAYSYEIFTQDLAQSGYEPERMLTLLVNEENEFKLSVAEELASIWTAAGVPVEVRALPWEEYAAALTAGEFDLYYGEVRLTADWNLNSLLSSGGALNYGGWSDERTEALLAEYAAAEDRAAAMERLCAYLQGQPPILPVCFKSASVLTRAEVLEGLEPTAAEAFYNLTECTVRLRSVP